MEKINYLKKVYDSNGYVVVKNFVNLNKVKNIKHSLLDYIKKNHSLLKKKDAAIIKKNNTINSISNLKKWNYVRKLQKTKKIKDLVKIFLGSKFKNFGAELFAKPAKVGLPAPIHQDNYYWNILDAKGITVWLALDNANKKNGAVFYYKKRLPLGSLFYGVMYCL